MLQPKKKVVKKPVKKQSHPSDDYKNMINPATGKKGGVGGEGTTPPFGPIKEGTRYYDMDKQKYSYRKKTDPPIKKPSMKKGGNVKKAFLGNVLGAATGLLGGGAGGGLLGGLLGGGGGKGAAGGAGGGMSKISKMFGGSMKKGGKVTKKAKTGTSLGMKSVKAGFDKNPGVTRADIITAAKGKAQKGKKLTPNYSNIKAGGFDSFKTPTAKDSADYREGFKTRVQKKDLKQYPSPSGAKVRGYNEAVKRTTKAKAGTSVKKCKYGCK
jgi:hypothetical protein